MATQASEPGGEPRNETFKPVDDAWNGHDGDRCAGRERVPLETVYSERWLLIGPKVRSELGERGSGFVFTNRMGNPFEIEGLAKVWATARTRACLEHVTGWRENRHFHASLLIADGMSPVAVAKRLGQKDATETLRTYSHLWPDDHAKMASIAETVFAASTERPSRVFTLLRVAMTNFSS